MLKKWPTPLLGPRAHFLMADSQSDWDALDQPSYGQILFFKTNLFHFESFMKVVGMYA